MECTRCNRLMELTFLDDELVLCQTGKTRVKHECPKCHVRVYGTVRGGKKSD